MNGQPNSKTERYLRAMYRAMKCYLLLFIILELITMRPIITLDAQNICDSGLELCTWLRLQS